MGGGSLYWSFICIPALRSCYDYDGIWYVTVIMQKLNITVWWGGGGGSCYSTAKISFALASYCMGCIVWVMHFIIIDTHIYNQVCWSMEIHNFVCTTKRWHVTCWWYGSLCMYTAELRQNGYILGSNCLASYRTMWSISWFNASCFQCCVCNKHDETEWGDLYRSLVKVTIMIIL